MCLARALRSAPGTVQARTGDYARTKLGQCRWHSPTCKQSGDIFRKFFHSQFGRSEQAALGCTPELKQRSLPVTPRSPRQSVARVDYSLCRRSTSRSIRCQRLEIGGSANVTCLCGVSFRSLTRCYALTEHFVCTPQEFLTIHCFLIAAYFLSIRRLTMGSVFLKVH